MAQENISSAPTSLGAPMLPRQKIHQNVHKKINQKYGWVDGTKMHAHAKFENE